MTEAGSSAWCLEGRCWLPKPTVLAITDIPSSLLPNLTTFIMGNQENRLNATALATGRINPNTEIGWGAPNGKTP